MSHFKPALSYPNRTTVSIITRVDLHRKILAVIRAVLPESLANHALYCVLENRKLLIYSQSAAWASQLRFYSPAMLAAVNAKTDVSVELIQVRILQQHPVQLITEPKKIPAPETIESIQDRLISLPESKLKQSLLSLSETLRKLAVEK